MIVLIKLLLAHFIGDFVLQPYSWVVDKERNKGRSVQLYYHIALHGILPLVLLWDINYWQVALSMMLCHGAIDLLKLYGQTEQNRSQWFIGDQVLHLVSIYFIWANWSQVDVAIAPIFEGLNVWVYATALLFLTYVSGITIQTLMKPWSAAIADNVDESLSNAGKYIGILERLFVFTFIVTGHWEAVGFLLAAKSVFRFGDLKESKDRKLTEYILIGTLLSFGIAMAVAILVVHVIASYSL